jgi:RHS repeat-associated protein
MKTLINKIISLLLIVLLPATCLGSEVLYVDTDAYGTPVAMSDSDGTRVWTGEYFPFGEQYRITNNQKPNNRGFIGKEKDTETGLTYFGARYYDEAQARFTTVDPVGPVNIWTGETDYAYLANPQMLNRYVYGLNNPYRYVDPDGRDPGSLATGETEEVTRCHVNPHNDPVENFYGGVIVSGGLIGTFAPELVTAISIARRGYKASEDIASKKGTFPDEIFSSKASKQVTPGTKTLEGQYIDDLGNVQPYQAHYDEFGRLKGRTDYNAGNKAHNIPDVHNHTYEWGPGKTPMETGSHIPGEYKP